MKVLPSNDGTFCRSPHPASGTEAAKGVLRQYAYEPGNTKWSQGQHLWTLTLGSCPSPGLPPGHSSVGEGFVYFILIKSKIKH